VDSVKRISCGIAVNAPASAARIPPHSGSAWLTFR
jgi:hypothetical protein